VAAQVDLFIERNLVRLLASYLHAQSIVFCGKKAGQGQDCPASWGRVIEWAQTPDEPARNEDARFLSWVRSFTKAKVAS
jgi:hypothetical protein